MERVTRIVCPVDLSQGARRAVAHAAALARLHQADLHLLHVPGEASDRPSHRAKCARSIGLAAVVAGALWGPDGADPHREVSLRLATERGHPVEAIAAYARRNEADLIVVGSRYGAARSWQPDASLASALGRSAPCRVLVVPQTDEGRATPPVRVPAGRAPQGTQTPLHHEPLPSRMARVPIELVDQPPA